MLRSTSSLRRRREADEQRVEVVEDRPILLEHRAVCLVDDHEVEMADPEAPLLVRVSSMSPIIVG